MARGVSGVAALVVAGSVQAQAPQANAPASAAASVPPLATVTVTGPATATAVLRVRRDSDPSTIAFELRALPEGSRVLEVGDLAFDLVGHLDDGCIRKDGFRDEFAGPWLVAGPAATKDRIETFFRRLKATGVAPDLVLVDPIRTLDVGSLAPLGHPTWGAIAADPRFAALRTRLGVNSLQDLASGTPDRLRWDYGVGTIFDDAVASAIVAPIRASFPGLLIGVRDSYGITPALASINAHAAPDVRTTSDKLPESGVTVTGRIDKSAVDWSRGNLGPAGGAGFDAVRKLVHRTRSIRGSDQRPVRPWISASVEGADEAVLNPFSETKYITELARLLLLDGAPGLVLEGSAANSSLAEVAAADLLQQVGQKFAPIEMPRPTWTSTALCAGVRVDAGEVWRIATAPEVRRIRVFINARPRSLDVPLTSTGVWLKLDKTQMLARDDDGSPLVETFDLAQPVPLVSTRATSFHSGTFSEFLRSIEVSTNVLEMYPQSPPNSPDEGDPSQWGDVARMQAGQSDPAGPEAGKQSFPGWNIQEFPQKPYGWGPTAVSGVTSTSIDGWVEDSPALRVLHDPQSWTGLLDVDYEGWCAEWRGAIPSGRSDGDRKMMAAFDAALQTIRDKYPRTHIAFYGLCEGWWPGNPASAGVLRTMMGLADNPVLSGSPHVQIPRGKLGAEQLLSAVKNLATARASILEDSFVDFVGRRCDAITPTCYMKSQSDGRPGWNRVELIAATTDAERSRAAALGFLTAPPGPDLAAWNARVYTGTIHSIGGRDTPVYGDPLLPALGRHSSNYWHTYLQVEGARVLQAAVLARTGRRLPILPVVGWHNPTVLINEQTQLPPFTVAEFVEGQLQAAKDAGADGVYIWDWYLPLAMEWIANSKDVDAKGSLSIVGLRDMLRQQLTVSGRDSNADGTPFLPRSNNVAQDPRWSDMTFLQQLSLRIEDSSRLYYRAVVEFFPPGVKGN
ncbi:MAG: hypothetical protein EXS00_06050 [Phycisphaerales bacterium]|nr:hypothetical protein [Phycisphaerales bacterium]